MRSLKYAIIFSNGAAGVTLNSYLRVGGFRLALRAEEGR